MQAQGGLKFLSRQEAKRKEELSKTLLQCTFKPQLMSSLPWTSARQKLGTKGLTAGERMYSDAIDKRRDWQLHLQKERQVGKCELSSS